MSIANYFHKILPQSTFKKLRKWYYYGLYLYYKPISEEEFRYVLEVKLGVKKGMTVFVHSSVDKMQLGFPIYRVLELLMEAVGPEGTLLFPCWQYNGRAEDYLNRYPEKVFDVKKTPTAMGLLPEIARRHKLAHRSLHPTSSIVALGKHAHELVAEHHLSVYPCGELSPYYKMMDYNSKIIGLGEKYGTLSFVHCVEDVLKESFPIKTLGDHPRKLSVKDKNGYNLEVETLLPHINIQNRDIEGYIKKHIYNSNMLASLKFKGSNFFSADPVALFQRMKELALRKITIYN